MTLWGVLALLATGVLLLGVAAWVLLYKSEGVYLGWRVVVWLYDVYANRYDRIKDNDRDYETYFIARPILRHLYDVPQPVILDVATGTARLPLTVLEQGDFAGRVIGLDLSRQMLFRAAIKLHGFTREQYDLLWYTAAELPFADDSVDLVACLEALEFLPRPQEALAELTRVLRPGGWLLITNRKGSDTKFFPGRIFPTETLLAILDQAGMVEIDVQKWQVDYDLVWARKAGDSEPAGARPTHELIRCPRCAATDMIPLDSGAWVCGSCEGRAPVGEDGVIELFRLQ